MIGPCRRFAWASIALLGLCPGGLADDRLLPADEDVVEDAFFEVRFRHSSDNIVQDAGTARRRMVRRGDRYITTEQSRLKFQIEGRVIEERQDSTQVEDLAGKVLEFAYADEGRQMRGTALRDNRVRVTRIKDDETVEREVEFPADMLTDNGNVRKLLAGPPRPGRPKQILRELSMYRALEGARVLEFEFLGTRRLDFNGAPVETYLFKQIDKEPPADRPDPWTVWFWVDRAGRLYKFEMETKSDEVTAWFGFNRTR
jgi:hypothetical protein